MATKKSAPPPAERPYADVDGVRVNPQLASLLVSTDSLKFDPSNARLHSVRNLKAVESSLRRFGFQLPILFDPETREVVAGNGRLKVAIDHLGWSKVPAIPFRGSPEELRAYAVMDNRTAELAEWDWQQLGEHLRGLLEGDLFTGEELGFEKFEIDPLLAADWSPGDVDGSEFEGGEKGHVVHFSDEDYEVVKTACEKAKERGEAHTPPILLTGLARAYITGS